MNFPSLDEIRQVREVECAIHRDDIRRPLLPMCVDVLADMETPVAAYCKTARGPYSFLLESVAGGERIASYSFIGIDPYLVMTHRSETATLRKIRSPGNEVSQYTIEEVPCHDPLEFI